MGQKFIGSEDVAVLALVGAATNGAGGWVEVPAEQAVLELDVTATSGGPHTISVVSDAGTGQVAAVASFSVSGTGIQRKTVSLGSFPGGRRIRAGYTIPSGALSCTLISRETRDGLP